jgi:hypothetical protein
VAAYFRGAAPRPGRLVEASRAGTAPAQKIHARPAPIGSLRALAMANLRAPRRRAGRAWIFCADAVTRRERRGFFARRGGAAAGAPGFLGAPRGVCHERAWIFCAAPRSRQGGHGFFAPTRGPRRGRHGFSARTPSLRGGAASRRRAATSRAQNPSRVCAAPVVAQRSQRIFARGRARHANVFLCPPWPHRLRWQRRSLHQSGPIASPTDVKSPTAKPLARTG